MKILIKASPTRLLGFLQPASVGMGGREKGFVKRRQTEDIVLVDIAGLQGIAQKNCCMKLVMVLHNVVPSLDFPNYT